MGDSSGDDGTCPFSGTAVRGGVHAVVGTHGDHLAAVDRECGGAVYLCAAYGARARVAVFALHLLDCAVERCSADVDADVSGAGEAIDGESGIGEDAEPEGFCALGV